LRASSRNSSDVSVDDCRFAPPRLYNVGLCFPFPSDRKRLLLPAMYSTSSIFENVGLPAMISSQRWSDATYAFFRLKYKRAVSRLCSESFSISGSRVTSGPAFAPPWAKATDETNNIAASAAIMNSFRFISSPQNQCAELRNLEPGAIFGTFQ